MTPAHRGRARALRRRIPYAHRRTLGNQARELLAAGGSKEEVARQIATTLDALLPLGAMGPLGVVLEAVDGVVLHLVALIIIGEVERAQARKAAGGQAP